MRLVEVPLVYVFKPGILLKQGKSKVALTKTYPHAGDITDALYDKHCYFADPTVKFTGK